MHPYNPYHYDSPYYQQYHRNPHYYHTHYSIRNPTQLDPTMFMNSARQSKNLIKDGQLILEKIAGSKPFSLEMMKPLKALTKRK